MLTLENIKGLHIELSARCGASCPFCSRNQKVREYGGHLITLADFKKLPGQLLGGLQWMTLAGNFGDMAANKDTPDIIEYTRSLNDRIFIEGDSNGAMQDEAWWSRLGSLFRQGSMVFSVDGLADTNAIHRKGTNFDKIMRNMAAFTRAEGVAHWQFIAFRHNEHQIDAAEKKAREMGCARFFVIMSREYDDLYPRPQTLDVKEKRDVFQAYFNKAEEEDAPARCKPWHNGSLYIAADGTVYPCCLAHCMYITEHNKSFDFMVPLTQDHIQDINFKTTPLADIISGPYFEQVQQLSRTNSYCRMKCNRFKKEIKTELVVRDVRLA